MTLDDDLAEQLKEAAHRLKKPFKTVLNESLRRGLSGEKPLAPMDRFVVHPHHGGLKPGFDETSFNKLADELEDEEIMKKLAAGK